jgi:endoglucanase
MISSSLDSGAFERIVLLPEIQPWCMINKFLISFLFCSISGLTFSQNAPDRFLHRDGRALKDSAGNAVLLRGVNLGGWLLWEGWMWGDGFKSQTRVKKRFSELVGKEETEKFEKSVFLNLITERDIEEISKAGFNVVRLPFNHRIFEFKGDTVSELSPGWAILDSVVGWCKKYGVYAVIDMHAAPGGQSIFFIADHTRHELLWKDEKSRKKTILLWKAISKHYAFNTTVAGYDLLNEPVPPKDRKLVNLYARIISGIRENDKNHLVILEGANFAKRFTGFHALPDSNMAFSFHIYTWLGGKPEVKVKAFAKIGMELNVPVWCGEWGENNYDLIRHTRDVMEDPENGFSGWCYWSWKRVHSRFPNLNIIEPGEHWMKIMSWFKYPDHAHRPTKEETLLGMSEFLQATHANLLRRDKDLYEILEVRKPRPN